MASRVPLIVLAVVAVVLALVVATAFDSPTSVFLLFGIVVVALGVGGVLSRRR